MCRFTCDYCHAASFEVYTFDDHVDAPSTWKLVKTHGWGAYNYAKTQLCCGDCVETLVNHDRGAELRNADNIRLEKNSY